MCSDFGPGATLPLSMIRILGRTCHDRRPSIRFRSDKRGRPRCPATSPATFERPWAHSFPAGLVPPSVTETASVCPNGVSRVETVHSFLNVVAQIVTFSIYTPMTILVQ